MTRRRWIADRIAGNRAWLTGGNADHLARVLRAQVGQRFDIAAEGAVRAGTITVISPDQVEFELGELVEVSALPEVFVLLAIFKFDRLEWAIEKLTELGVARILPVIARRTETHLAKAAVKRVERWRKLAREAAQQSRRAVVPEVAAPAPLKKAITVEAGCRIVLAENQETTSLKSALAQCAPPVSLAIGPEGGWAPEELQLFEENGWKKASLGDNILRAETAAIGAMAITMAEVEQLPQRTQA